MPFTILLAVAWALGGGGVGAAFPNLAVQLTALGLLAARPATVVDFWIQAPPALRWLAAVTLLFPLAQMVPLPPAIWHGLPGRGALVQALDLIGAESEWRPLSTAPHRTLLAFVGLLAPFAALVFAWGARAEPAAAGLALLAGLGLASLFLGALQLATANTQFLIHAAGRGTADLHATFANRNSSGLFFVVALCCLVALPPTGRKWLNGAAVRLGAGGLLVLGAILSHSRSAICLAALPLAVVAIAALRRMHAEGPRRDRLARLLVPLGAMLAGAAMIAILAPGNNRVADAVGRFAQDGDAREYIWPDAMVTVARFWPVGGGVGTFDTAFELDESLETLQPLRAGRAHNEFIELAYEGGIAELILLAAWLAWCALAAVRGWRGLRGPACAAPLVLAISALQSITDYPLRNQALLCIAAYMIGVLAAVGCRTALPGGDEHRSGSTSEGGT